MDAGPHTPAVLRVLAPVSSTAPSAFPRSRVGSASRVCPRITISRGVAFRGCRYFVMFRPPSLLAPQIVPTAANTAAGQPGLLRPSRTRFVASPRIGYANRPNTGNWRYGDLHPARLSALSAAPSTMPRFQSPPRRTQHADFPLYAHLPASPQECEGALGHDGWSSCRSCRTLRRRKWDDTRLSSCEVNLPRLGCMRVSA